MFLQNLKIKGFSFIELIIVLAILSIIIAFSLPFTGKLLEQYRSKNEQARVLDLIVFARETAMAEGQIVTLCPSSDKIHCSSNWSLPIIVFLDANASGIAEDADKLLRVTDSTTYGTLTFSAFPKSNVLQFDGDGFSLNQNGTFQYCLKNQSWQIIINRLGRLRISEEGGC